MHMIPEGQMLIFDDGIYTSEKFINDYERDIDKFKGNIEALDLWCPNCKKEKTFNHANSDYIYNSTTGYKNDPYNAYGNNECPKNNIFYKSYMCPTCHQKVIYLFKILENCVMKIGQFPSLRDLEGNQLAKYNKSQFIDQDDINNMKKASTLACESFYIGAYSYMRRVFENLINRTYQHNIEHYSFKKEEFDRKHMDEKVALIKNDLPVDDDIYNVMYKNLSRGIHQLTEKECEERFISLYSVMVDILEDEISQKEKQERRKNLKSIIDSKH